jgi:hypothetical protein
VIALDDNIEDHPKFVELSNDAFALWVRCIGYCRRNLTDGYIPEAAAVARARSRNPRRAISELVTRSRSAASSSPLWAAVPGGYLVHDYLDWNPSRADVEAKREQKRAAAKLGGEASGRTRANRTRTNIEAPCFGSGSSLANPDPIRIRSGSEIPPVVPQGDPTPASELRGPAEPPPPKPSRRRPASACPASTATDADVTAWLATWKLPSLADAELRKFVDHHRARDSRFSDWAAAWRTWSANAATWGKRALPPVQPVSSAWAPRPITAADPLPEATGAAGEWVL